MQAIFPTPLRYLALECRRAEKNVWKKYKRRQKGELRLVGSKTDPCTRSRETAPDVLRGEKDLEGQSIQGVSRGEQSC